MGTGCHVKCICMQNVIQMEASSSWFFSKERSCVEGKQMWFGWSQEVTRTGVPAVGPVEWRPGRSGQGHQWDWALLFRTFLVQSSPRSQGYGLWNQRNGNCAAWPLPAVFYPLFLAPHVNLPLIFLHFFCMEELKKSSDGSSRAIQVLGLNPGILLL